LYDLYPEFVYVLDVTLKCHRLLHVVVVVVVVVSAAAAAAPEVVSLDRGTVCL
jgi:hypothetical protein